MADTFNDTAQSLSPPPVFDETFCDSDWASVSDFTLTLRKIILIAILVCGLAGNGAVLSLIAFIRELRSGINIYIVVLCGANVVMLVTYLPMTLAEFRFTTMHPGFSNFVNYELKFYSSISILALIILSFGRWRAVVRPMTVRGQTTTAHTVQLIAVFVTAAVVSLPFAFSYEPVDYYTNVTNESETLVSKSRMRDQYVTVTTYYGAIVLYLVPLAIIAGLYISMATKLLSHGVNIRESIRRYKKTQARRSRVAWVVLGLVLSFAICWLPNNLFLIMHVNYLHCTFPRLINFLKVWQLPAYMLNTCADPFSIFLLGSRFRRHLIRALHLGRCFGHTAEKHMHRGTLNGNTVTTVTPERSSRRSSPNDAIKLQPHSLNEDHEVVQGKRSY